MAKLTISDAARVAGVARSTLHRAIRAGRLSVDPDGHVDTAELLRAGYTLQRSTLQISEGPLQDATPRSSDAQQGAIPSEKQALPAVHQERDLLRLERDLLRRELEAAHLREQAALEREQAAREREALLLHMLEQAQQQSQRLLDMPRSVPAPSAPAPYVPAPADTAPPAPGQVPFPSRSTVRQRILALLREYPEGLTTTEIRVFLRADRPLTDTCMGMLRQGLLRRVGPGRYVAHNPADA
jgi:hypothetical protein